MDGRSANRSFFIQIGLVSAGVVVLYAYLTHLDTPNLTIFELIKGVVKLLLRVFFLPFGRIGLDVWWVFWDVLFLFLVILAGIAFFVQFSLPVRNFVQRVLAFVYLTLHAFPIRLHAPAIKVDNGAIPKTYPRNRVIPRRGVIIFDTASAGLLRTPVGFTRSVGPGLVFTRPNEYLADAVDLHPKIWPVEPLGPRGDEDPFKPWDEKNEAREAYDARLKRRYETSGQTRDSIEIVPNISVACQIATDLVPDQELEIDQRGGLRAWIGWHMQSETITGFGYSPEAVRRAIAGGAIDPRHKPEEVDRKRLSWYELPAFLAVDLWREYLRKFTFEELFTELPAYGGLTAFQVIQTRIRERLTQTLIEAIDTMGQPAPGQIESREFQILQNRGTRVRFAVIRNLKFDPQIDQQLEDKWFAYWRWRAEEEREQVDRMSSYRMHEGEQQALREFAYSAARRFPAEFMEMPRPTSPDDRRDQMRESLELMLRGTLDHCVTDTMLHQRLVGEEAQLVAIIDWLRRQRN